MHLFKAFPHKISPTVQSFIFDNGFTLLVSFSISFLLFVVWYYGVEISFQNKEKKSWISANVGLLRQHLILKHLLELLGNQLSVCERCENGKMQLWNYQQDRLLVIRCKSCQMNYTFNREYCHLIRLILSELDGNRNLLNTLKSSRNRVLGKFLIQKLAIDVSSLMSDVSSLGVFHFVARNQNQMETKQVREIIIRDWKEVKSQEVHLWTGT